MKEFFKTRLGRAITTGATTAIIWAICTPIFTILFRGGIKGWDTYEFVVEPILIGIFLGIFEYFFQFSNRRKGGKK